MPWPWRVTWRAVALKAARKSLASVKTAQNYLSGCAITDVLCEMWPSERIRVADRGLREGILIGLMQDTHKSKAPKAQSVSVEASSSDNIAAPDLSTGDTAPSESGA